MTSIEPTNVLAPAPEILHQGKYRLYKKSDGAIRVQYRRDDKEEDDFMEIPGFMLRMAEGLSTGEMSPLAALKLLKNMGRNE